LNSRKRFRVLCQKGLLPLTTVLETVPHLTGLVSISAAGKVLEPVIVLRDLQKLGDLADFEGDCFFATSSSGWLTRDLWVYYAIVFSAQMSQYRLTLPEPIRDEDILLIVDGHVTRVSYLATMIFMLNGIDVVVLPSHSTHLVQPFAVSVASPLKVYFKRFLDARMPQITAADPARRERTAIIRRVLVESFLNALRAAAIPANAKKRFEHAGIVSFNPARPLESQYAMTIPEPGLRKVVSRNMDISEVVLTFPDGLQKLCRHERARDIIDDDYAVDYRNVWQNLLWNPVREGRPISPPPPLFVRSDDGTIHQISLT
jgi:hypothetical protein